ncbi:hypothetical protein C475_16401 [Halosimplex carlsbadense 2-9-1]|uniref:Uncharacterized protein n=1 Tax=Halosimplex carlsbadense 2-9-1 TaxID=797114 RepID=M0CHC9_9EURY|nr:hypothetical protein [Halosimplex carlsbadense]ELZ22700.1 hypothetical protein C475_16401 [Halosimplex carlsbadense 2-9-1]
MTLRTPLSASPAGSRSGEGDAVGDGVAVGVDVGAGEGDGVAVGAGVGEGEGEGVAVGIGVWVTDCVGTDGSVVEGVGDSVPERLLQPDRATSRSSPTARAVVRGCPMEGIRQLISTLR